MREPRFWWRKPGLASGLLAPVAAAYGWPADIAAEEALERLLKLNLERAAAGR